MTCCDRVAVLALERDDQFQPFLDLGQPFGVELEALGIILERARQVAKLFEQHLGLVGRLAHVGVDARQLLQLAHDLADHVDCARQLAIFLRENGLRSLGQVHQGFSIAQPPPLGLQLLLLALAQVGGGNFAGLKRKQVDALGQGAGILAQPLQLAAHLAQAGRLLGHLAAQGQQPRITVEQLDMGLGLEQVQVFALPVDVDQQVGQFAERLQRDAAPVDATDVAPVKPHFTAEHHPVWAVGVVQPLLVEQVMQLLRQLGVVGQPERGLDLGHLAAGAHRLGGGAFAQQQADGVDNDRLACARFARQDIETGAKGEVQLVDDGEIANPQFVEHSTGILPYAEVLRATRPGTDCGICTSHGACYNSVVETVHALGQSPPATVECG